MLVESEGRSRTRTRSDCALTCAKSGFGIVDSSGNYLKFDDKGNQEALKATAELEQEGPHPRERVRQEGWQRDPRAVAEVFCSEGVATGVRRRGDPPDLSFDSREFAGRGENLGHNCLHIVLGGAVIDDAGAQSELAVDGGVGNVDPAAAYDPGEDFAIKCVQSAVASTLRPHQRSGSTPRLGQRARGVRASARRRWRGRAPARVAGLRGSTPETRAARGSAARARASARGTGRESSIDSSKKAKPSIGSSERARA